MKEPLDERGDPVSKTHDPDRTRYSATEARQGFLGRPVLTVLAVSLALVLAVWGAVEIWGSSTDREAGVDDTQTTSTTSGTSGPDAETGFDADPPAGTTQENAPTDEDPTAQSGTGGESQTTTDDGSVK